jgi:hypothetical protein
MDRSEQELTFTEAPASVTVKCYVSGYDTMLTLRAMTGAELVTKLPAVIKALEAIGAQPTVATAKQDQEQEANADDPSWCPIHNVHMKRREKDGQVWYSHKSETGEWCRGRA